MATTDDEKEDALAKSDEIVPAEAETSAPTVVDESVQEGVAVLGTARYVHAAFIVAAILAAYVSAKVLVICWGLLAEWPEAVRAVPQLVEFDEDKRENFTYLVGALMSIVAVVQIYRKERIRSWADEVAAELTRVTWPPRETVMQGTLVVVVASIIATLYVAVLDRFWGFLTNLVYGA
jgi:preprotein translocase subunit SecE